MEYGQHRERKRPRSERQKKSRMVPLNFLKHDETSQNAGRHNASTTRSASYRLILAIESFNRVDNSREIFRFDG
jgi:hypothetical protein